jgi:hypothetical protein
VIVQFYLMLATCSFWFVRIENMLVIFQSMYEAGRWPVGIYPPWLRFTLTFLVPVAFAVTVPARPHGRLTAHSARRAGGAAAGGVAVPITVSGTIRAHRHNLARQDRMLRLIVVTAILFLLGADATHSHQVESSGSDSASPTSTETFSLNSVFQMDWCSYAQPGASWEKL